MASAPHRPSLAPQDPGDVPRRSLVLAGGGMRVGYQAGVLLALEEAGLTFAHIDGTSGGTINLAMLMSGLSPTAMCDRWRTLNVRDFVSFLPFHEYLKDTSLVAMGDADGVVEKVFPHLGIDVDRIRAARGIDATFNVCSFTQKRNVAIPHHEVVLDLLVAGISLPIFMPAVEHEGQVYTDSVWIKDANLMEAVRRGADEIWLVWCIGNTGDYKGGAFNQYVHMIELAANGGLTEEFDRIAEINARIEAGERVGGRTEPIRLHVIKPEHALPLDPDFYLGRIDGATLIAIGYADANRYLAARSDVGVAFDWRATTMAALRPGIAFRETMQGPFALGCEDPGAGRDQGQRGHSELVMRAAIYIHDLDRFVADPGHAGYLAGEIDFAPFGMAIPAKRGTFNLFSPTDDPRLKRMVYEMAFEHAGVDYYLAGWKEVRDDPGFDLLRDTTTLLVRLHRGKDTSGPVIGAGTLRLGVAALARLAVNLHVTNVDGFTAQAKTLARFGQFFLGSLYASYVGSKPWWKFW